MTVYQLVEQYWWVVVILIIVILLFATASGFLRRHLWEIVVLLIAVVIFIVIAYVNVYHEIWPLADRWPMFVAPMLTFVIGFLTCIEQMKKSSQSIHKNEIIILNALTILILFGACNLLVAPHSPVTHLIIVFFLFAYFIYWDGRMIKWVIEEEKVFIRIASLYINWPTCIGLGIILLLIGFHAFHKTGHLVEDILEGAFKGYLPDPIKQDLIKQDLIWTEAEAFISGAIAFHLAVTAGAYLFGTYSRQRIGGGGVTPPPSVQQASGSGGGAASGLGDAVTAPVLVQQEMNGQH
ncbi:MAG: hypothetical protein V7641_2391 [Blastocatellia bacterium]